MTPVEAGFNGQTRYGREGFVFRLKRGNKPPSDYPEHKFAKQLIWYCPENQNACLLWCNADNQWFNLTFSPIEKP